MRSRLFAVLVTMAIVGLGAAFVTDVFAQGGGRRGRQGRGMMGDMWYLERAWTAISFQIQLEPEQMALLQPAFAEALQARTDALNAAAQTEDRETRMQLMVSAITQCRETLSTKLSEVLTDEQLTQLDKLMSANMGFGGPRRGGNQGGQQDGDQDGGGAG